MAHQYERSEGLSCISDVPNGALINVVFVHGLGGGAHSTWDSGSETGLGFWPRALAKEHPRCCVWTLQYTARLFDWNPFARSRTIDLLDRAVWLVQSLIQARIPEKPIVFVTHSLGGVLVKQALQFARLLGPAEWRSVWDQTQAVVFLATPHVGALLADAAVHLAEAMRGTGLVARLTLRPSPALKNLEKNNPTLRYLSDWYRDQTPEKGIETYAFAEGRPCNGVMIVDQSSANPQVANGVVVPLPEDDHVSIAKPSHTGHLVYSGIHQTLARAEGRAATAMANPVSLPPMADKLTVARQTENRLLVARLCGDWWERIKLEGASALSIFRIEHDAVFNSVVLGGRSYNADGVHSATWHSVIARVDMVGTKFVLQYVWKGEHTDPKLANVPFHGFGVMEFDEPVSEGRVRSGSGRFWNVDEFHPDQTVLKPIELRRVKEPHAVRIAYEGTGDEVKDLIKRTIDPQHW